MPITFYSPLKYTFAKIGKKPVTVKSLVKDKKRIAYLLSITASGDKLEPYVIFQGKKYSSVNFY